MACLLLVKANDSPVPDSPGKWLDMQTVAVVDVDHVLGSGELTPQNGGGFYHVTVSDRLKGDADIQQYLEPLEDTTDPENPVLLARRKLYLDPNNPVIVPLPAPGGTGAVEVSYTTLQSATEQTTP